MYRLWTRLRNNLYERKILTRIRPKAFVISIGNLTWGGTGKTSLVTDVSRFLTAKGLRVAIVSRGYRRKTTGPMLVSDGSQKRCAWQEAGDEAYLVANALPETIVVVSEQRAEALPLIEPLRPDVIVLDDAFQHRKMERDLDIVMIDATEDITALRLIPLGKLREAAENVKRADAVVLMHRMQANENTLRWTAANVNVPVFEADYVLSDPEEYRDRRIGAFCAIGAPNHFFQLLRRHGAELVLERAFRDHHIFKDDEIMSLRNEAQKRGAEYVVTTLKDSVRIQERWLDDFIRVARVNLKMPPEPAFYDFILEHLNRSGKHPATLR